MVRYCRLPKHFFIPAMYRPYKPKRTTRASIARAKGLEPLANYILEQRDSYDVAIDVYAADFISSEEGRYPPALAGRCPESG